ncbi:hypothetical protein THZG08_680006 [Vibrio owensii]|uniref:Uncharacterized protein n=1 Tax=Vibrio jasicida TaxID=766224 RepID=A0AAU9R0H6_9VIBR|nr:hypothetical protein THZG08_680006 [Vibrio owensii]CAH1589741.1 hypothetical protein THOA03_670006 [Vibrio owensii]CAH1601278.1 hypothetical protein THF1C08_690005 [Vibrio jasicida]CAH1603556.1 hypothetical protein THF1A12_710005 [Vibrio jasicida]
MIVKNKIALLLTGLFIAFASWLFFNTFQVYSFYILLFIVILVVSVRKFSRKD